MQIRAINQAGSGPYSDAVLMSEYYYDLHAMYSGKDVLPVKILLDCLVPFSCIID